MAAPERPPDPARTLYGRRRGKRLRPGQAALLADRLPALTVPLPAPPGLLDPHALFPSPKAALWLEIGFGAGEHLAWQAARNPDIGIIGCEPFVNGIARLLRAIADAQLDNVRIHGDDARLLLTALPGASLDRCFLLFPDPWPKARHARRRFVQPETLDLLARALRPGGELRMASDDPGLVDWMLSHTRRHGAFSWTAAEAKDWRVRPGDWPATRYEQKALASGRVPAFLSFRRRPEKD